jgi:aconitate hydratase 2 / 2-methylisocitrate dehydratase
MTPSWPRPAAEQLKHTLLMFDAFHDVEERPRPATPWPRTSCSPGPMRSGSSQPPALCPKKITVTVFKVPGETNTDDLSPAPDAWSRPDIPVHANAMLQEPARRHHPEVPGTTGPLKQIEEVKAKGFPVAYVGDVVGTGSSRKSATNSVLWFFGDDIPYVPNKRAGGFCIGGKIAPIFFNTMEDSGALPVRDGRLQARDGRRHRRLPLRGQGVQARHRRGAHHLRTATQVILDEVRAGGRIPLIIGRGLTTKARESLGLPPPTSSACPSSRPTPARATPWRRRWSARPAAWRACARAPTASRR